MNEDTSYYKDLYEELKQEYRRERRNARDRARERRREGHEVELPERVNLRREPTDYKQAAQDLEDAIEELKQIGYKKDYPKEDPIGYYNMMQLIGFIEEAPNRPDFDATPPRSKYASTRNAAVNASLTARDILLNLLYDMTVDYGYSEVYKMITKHASYELIMELAQAAMLGYKPEDVKTATAKLVSILNELGLDAKEAAALADELDDEW